MTAFFRCTVLLCWIVTIVSTVSSLSAQESNDAAIQARHERFAKMLTGSKFQGQFTVDGKPLNQLEEEAYELEKVEKMPEADLWSITARIKYGKKDYKVPVPIYVKWAGETPVLTMDNLTLPGYGTFSTRVVLHGDKYAGTWQHDKVGGHLFGRIIPPPPAPEASK